MTSYEAGKLCGWHDLPDEVDEVVASLPLPTFAEAGRRIKGDGAKKEKQDVWFWAAEEKVVGKVLDTYDQEIGDCVSMGWARGIQDLMFLEIASGEPEQVPPKILARLRSESGKDGVVATEPIYGGSRVEVGGGRINGDGSIGAWAAEWVTEGGTHFRTEYPGDGIDLTRYSGTRAKDWGRRGCPDSIEPEGREHLIRTVTQVRGYEEARDLLVNGYPVPIASDQGFAMRRSRGGWCEPSGTWMHLMVLRGHLVTKGDKPAVIIQNSWGDYLGSTNNKVTLESGREVTLPPGCFLARPETITRMARQGDTFACSGFNGFPSRELNWIF